MLLEWISMFDNAPVFNNGASSGVSTTLSWDVSSVTELNIMFAMQMLLMQDISSWNTSSLRQIQKVCLKAQMFLIVI